MMHAKIAPDNDTWEPMLPGMSKRLCAHCGHYFSSRGASTCPTCLAKHKDVVSDGQHTSQIPARTKRQMK